VRVGGGDGSRGTIPKLFHATLAAAAAPRNGLAAVESGDRWEVRRPVGRLPLGVARLLTRTGVATGCYSGKICGPATLLIGIILVASYSPSSSTRYYTCRVYTPSHSWRRTCSRPRRRYPHRHHTRRIVQIPTDSIRLGAVLHIAIMRAVSYLPSYSPPASSPPRWHPVSPCHVPYTSRPSIGHTF